MSLEKGVEPETKKIVNDTNTRGRAKRKQRVRKDGCVQAPLEFADRLGSDLMREGLKKRAINAALCMMHGKSSRQLRPVIIPSKQKVRLHIAAVSSK